MHTAGHVQRHGEAVPGGERRSSPGPFRQTVLLSADVQGHLERTGQGAHRVRDEELWKSGVSELRGVLPKELHIRKATALKLTPASGLPRPARAQLEARAPRPSRAGLRGGGGARRRRGARRSSPPRSTAASGTPSGTRSGPSPQLQARELSERFPRPAPEPPPEMRQGRRLAPPRASSPRSWPAVSQGSPSVAERSAATSRPTVGVAWPSSTSS